MHYFTINFRGSQITSCVGLWMFNSLKWEYCINSPQYTNGILSENKKGFIVDSDVLIVVYRILYPEFLVCLGRAETNHLEFSDIFSFNISMFVIGPWMDLTYVRTWHYH